MNRIFRVIVLLLVLTSCEDDVKFNNPAVQGLKENVLWRATLFTAVQASDGSLTIEAYQKNDILTLNIASVAVKTYLLGDDDINKVTLLEKEGEVNTVFSTGENRGNGQIAITEYDAINHTVTGEFNFNSETESTNASNVKNVNFKKGIFYKVPVTTGTKLSDPIK
jgi:hypothetical protein